MYLHKCEYEFSDEKMTGQFAKWGKWDSASPGTCMPCVQQQFLLSGSTPIAVACNASAGQFSDCCYSCRQAHYFL